MQIELRRTAVVSAVLLATSLTGAVPAFAADTVPAVYARTAQYSMRGITPVRFHTSPGMDMSAVTSLTLFADNRKIGTDTAAPWGIDWDTTGFDGFVTVSTVATTATGSSVTRSQLGVVDNIAPTGLTVGFPRRDGYIGRGGELAVEASDNRYMTGSELVVGGRVVSSKDLHQGGNLDLGWNVTVPNGRTAMTVRVWDEAGNVTALTRTVTVDNDKPVITGSTTAGAAVRGRFTVALTGFRDASPFAMFEASLIDTRMHRYYQQENSRKVTIDGRELPDGRYTLGWQATDAAGNTGVVKRALIVDNRVPTVSITKAPKSGTKVAKKFTVTAKAADTYGIARVQLLVNGKVVATDRTAGYSFTVNPKKYGKKFTVRVRAYDKAGNLRYSAARTYKR
ncbi:MAG TPA: Ig-like domain-containing protein [Actinoplanes sp.]|nr:Ig-like domain-containing protein [Actinoplanes sp.]